MRPLPISVCHPTRKPYSAGFRFRDGKGPPPCDFFDETQDHLGALMHAGTGWAWAIATEDFDGPVYPANYLGGFRYQNFAAGLTLGPAASGDLLIQGEHGVWRGISGGFDYDLQMQENACFVSAHTPGVPGSGDFLVSCRMLVLNRALLDPVRFQGVWVSCGLQTGGYPALCGGGDTPNWQVFSPPGEGLVPAFFDTGIPLHDSQNTMPDQVRRAWHTVQISRVDGALRFHINGRLVRLTGNGLTDREGIYYPVALPELRRFFRVKRRFAGPANQGFYIDFFHRACRRG